MSPLHPPPVSLRIAFIGKGGGGKSTIAGTSARLLARGGRRVLALDVDTMPGLAYALGLTGAGDAGLPEELGVKRKKKGWALRRRISAATLVKRYAIEAPDGVRFLQLGKLPGLVRPGSTVAFRHVLESFRTPGWSIVGDLAAGTRQGFFGWAGFASAVAMVAEPTEASLVTAKRLRRLGESMPDARIGLVLNKVRAGDSPDEVGKAAGLPVWASVPYDRDVESAERAGRALLDAAPHAAAVAAIAALLSRLEELEEGSRTT